MRHELEDGVEREKLNARLAKNDFAFHPGAGTLQHARRPRIAIADRILDQASGPVDEPVIDAPRVDPDGGERPALAGGDRRGPPQARLDPVEQPIEVPPEVTGGLARRISKPVRFFDGHALGEPADQHAAAAGAEVDSRVQGGAVH